MAVLAVSITSCTSMLGMKYNAAALASDGTLTLSVLIACLVKFFVCLFSASERCSAFPEGDQVGPDDLSFVNGEDNTR